jgi:hypothetical protein
MANSLTVTVTAPIGPGDSASAVVISNARAFHLNGGNGTVEVVDSTGKSIFFDANATTTLTATASSGVFTVTVAQ